jgi:lactoylglutathione lyase
MNITELSVAGIPTTDQDRALDFYVNTLGFEKRFEAPFGDGLRWIEVAPKGATTTVALCPTPPGQPVGVDTGLRFTVTDADADHKELVAHGVDVDPQVMRWPGVPPMFSLRDTEGNTIYLVERVHG